MRIEIGLPNPIPGIDGATLVEWARRAEDLGLDELTLDPTIAEVDQVDRLADALL
jgi:hypothetical protein